MLELLCGSLYLTMESEGQDFQEYRQHSAMDQALDSEPPAQSSMQEYRKRYQKEHREFCQEYYQRRC